MTVNSKTKRSKQSPWLDDKLERNVSAEFLTTYLCNRYEKRKSSHGAETIVLALNSDWGFGKTYLLKNWKLQLEELDYPVVYFDAWENDYTDDPLVGFISEVDKALKPRLKNIPVATRLLSKTINSAKKMIRPATGVLVDIVAKKLTSYSVEQLKEIYSDAADGKTTSTGEAGIESELTKDVSTLLSTCASAALKEHTDKQIAIQTFKRNLFELISHLQKVSSVRLPLFIFVDELDRCRPTYAVELLENIKHLFGVEGVYFVVAINIGQLSHSVSAIYGDKFNAEQYLKRFFDQEYLLPPPNNEKFAGHLFSLLGLDKETRFFTGLNSNLYKSSQAETLFSIYATSFNLSLRDQQQIAAALKAITLVSSFKTIHLNYLLFLLMVRHRSNQAFMEIVSDLATTPNQANFNSITKSLLVQDVGVLAPVQRSDPFAPTKTHVVSIANVAWTYHSHAMSDLKKIRDMEINSYDFPRTVLAKLAADEMPSSYYPDQPYQSTLRAYPAMVGQAGQLIT